MSGPTHSPDSISPDEALPRVEPPNAGFILQLFIVPAIIVIIIVMVWLMFNWLAHRGDDPQAYKEALMRDNAARWQAAVNLANALRRPNNRLKKDAALAKDLSSVLQGEIKADRRKYKENDITLRAYLCRALGEFDVPDGLPVLLEAASVQHDEAEITVRRSALEAIALLASGPAAPEVLKQHELMEVLLQCSRDEDSGIRSRAAYALGVVEGERGLASQAKGRLAELLHDPAVDVRYNAATGLARQGDARAVPLLAQMLDPAQVVGLESEDDPGAREFKRASILANGLKATEKLAKANREADLETLRAAADKLAQSDVEQKVRAYANRVAKELSRRRETAAAPR